MIPRQIEAQLRTDRNQIRRNIHRILAEQSKQVVLACR